MTRARSLSRLLDDQDVTTFAANDATPSVAGAGLCLTANTSATTVTAFDDGHIGQDIVVVISDAYTTIDFTGTSLKGNAGVNWSPGNGDFMRCTFDGTYWLCQVTDVTA